MAPGSANERGESQGWTAGTAQRAIPTTNDFGGFFQGQSLGVDFRVARPRNPRLIEFNPLGLGQAQVQAAGCGLPGQIAFDQKVTDSRNARLKKLCHVFAFPTTGALT